MTEYENFESMFIDLQDDIQESLIYEVTDEVKVLLDKSVRENVYAVYQPSKYKRRGMSSSDTEGLSHAFTPKKVTNGVEIWSSVRPNFSFAYHKNQTSNMDGWFGDDWVGNDIADIVQSGVGYTWKNSRIAKSITPRPFMRPVQNLLDSGMSDILVFNALKKRGWQ